MNKHKTFRLLATIALAVVALAAVAAQGSAAPKDRNSNGIPDAWEKKHDISTKKDRGNRDADADGARNRCEYQAKTDPNNADSDANGVADGDEDSDGDGATNRAESNLSSNCGRANSHRQIRRATVTSFTDDVLVLTVRGGGTVTASVSDKLRCEVKQAAKTVSSAKSGKSKDKKPAACTTADLVEGVAVHKAKVKSKKFVSITLVK